MSNDREAEIALVSGDAKALAAYLRNVKAPPEWLLRRLADALDPQADTKWRLRMTFGLRGQQVHRPGQVPRAVHHLRVGNPRGECEAEIMRNWRALHWHHRMEERLAKGERLHGLRMSVYAEIALEWGVKPDTIRKAVEAARKDGILPALPVPVCKVPTALKSEHSGPETTSEARHGTDDAEACNQHQ